ncbi:MAG: carbamoyltransferase C-terminal domain-containing protein [Candidatus Aminicenantes bacterium]|jgi:carbamoyltransferase
MFILGLMGMVNTLCHDGSAALFKDGVIVAASEQERFSRRKHAHGESPVEAALFCLEYANIKLKDVDYITYGWLENDLNASDDEVLSPWLIKSLKYSGKILPPQKFGYKNYPPIYHVRHHIAHINSALFESGFHDAVCLVLDGQGESESITMAEIKNGEMNIIKQFGPRFSFGIIYDAATYFCGLGNDASGKFMGLSSYGKILKTDFIRFDPGTGVPEVPIPENNDISITFKHWLNFFKETFYPFREGNGEDVIYYIDFAATIQQSMEKTIIALLKDLKANTSSENLVISGGVGLNCIINKKITDSGLFKDVFVLPASNDAGCSIGSIYELCKHLEIEIKRDKNYRFNPFLGPSYENDEISVILKDRNINAQYLPDEEMIDNISGALAENKIICWFQGRSEFGPRALGNRSIIGNPGFRENLYKINKIKKREIWRPLAPSVLEEHYKTVFNGMVSNKLANYMLTTAQIRKEWFCKIPVVVHIDNTTRPQIVTKHDGKFYNLIKAFYHKTNLPLLINTSFNLQGEPIVNSPQEAIISFYREKDLDILVLGNYYIDKSG